MKKVLNLSVILAVLMAAFSFTSCGNSDDTSAPEITIDSVTESTVYGSITSENDLKSVDLQLDGRSVDGWPKTDFKVGQPISGEKGSYIIAIRDLNEGADYKIVAIDKEDKQDSKSFTTKGGSDDGGKDTLQLSAAQNFNVGRGKDLDPAVYPASANGITWTSNAADGVTANFSGNVVILTKADFDAIKTQEELATAFEAGTKATSFQIKSDTNFKPIYLIVKDGETLRLVEAISCKFAEGANKAVFSEKH